MYKKMSALILALLSFQSFGWNAVGHRLVAQVAYNHLTPAAKQTFNQINHALDSVYRPQTLVNSAVWLDTVHYQGDVNWYDTMHYVNKYFSNDGTVLPSPQKINAVWAIDHAIKNLESSKTRLFDKGIALRILIHVTGDLHQPMHAVTQVSRELPDGDMGGNLFYLGANRVSHNLHGYWDNAGGLFKSKKRLSDAQIARRAQQLEKQWPCRADIPVSTAEDWLKESNALALRSAYRINPHTKPDANYQKMTQAIAAQRVALAGCRLAKLMNEMALASR